MKRTLNLLLCFVLILSLACPALATGVATEQETAAALLQAQGLLAGNERGELNLEGTLPRAQLAVILSQLSVNPEHIAVERSYYARQCPFGDVPEWARTYVGVCAVHGLMAGYGSDRFGPSDLVTPQMACTVILRWLELDGWDYASACDKALELNLTPAEALAGKSITRGDMAVLIYRAQGNMDYASQTPVQQTGNVCVVLPTDGSQYIPQAGDKIACDDGTVYTITDVSRWDKNAFAAGPIGPLPTPTCDWSKLPQPELPAAEARHFDFETSDCLFVRNLYETQRMLYTLYNAIGANPETWQNGEPVLFPSGNEKVKIKLTIDSDDSAQFFWPWREWEIVNNFNSCPPGTYSLEAWDVYRDGIFQYTEYKIHVK